MHLAQLKRITDTLDEEMGADHYSLDFITAGCTFNRCGWSILDSTTIILTPGDTQPVFLALSALAGVRAIPDHH